MRWWGSGHTEMLDPADLAQCRGRLVQRTLLGDAQVLDRFLGAADQRSQPGDLVLGGSGLGGGPLVKGGRGQDPFPVPEQSLQVVTQLGQIGRVGAEMTAPQAAEPERARMTAGRDVGRFRARAERDRDRTDPSYL